ncbi:hypothetical protein DN062_00035 [Nitrincola tibetensis]|uniref:DUF883 domain-containing protein n=1 Tax=Nitrincola tibetensis TaxID=2219697 RepID=A0A364NR87_9GAMM|nr:DUF883 family protein [Nitrincola tibetensis]RAU19520.1 hypothetical protein DN062_00035 [Nitrincola tibetensis]
MKSSDKTSSLSNEFSNIIKDFESLLKEADTLGGEEFADVKEKLLSRLTSAKKEMTKRGLDMADKVHETSAEVSEKICDEPWKAVGTAAVVGLLIGYLFTRR